MEIIRMRLTRVVDFGPVVSLSGTELTTQRAMTVHLDHCPSLGIGVALRALQFAPPMVFDAEHLLLSIDVVEEGAAHPTHDQGTDGPRYLTRQTEHQRQSNRHLRKPRRPVGIPEHHDQSGSTMR